MPHKFSDIALLFTHAKHSAETVFLDKIAVRSKQGNIEVNGFNNYLPNDIDGLVQEKRNSIANALQ